MSLDGEYDMGDTVTREGPRTREKLALHASSGVLYEVGPESEDNQACFGVTQHQAYRGAWGRLRLAFKASLINSDADAIASPESVDSTLG
ncbi:MAG: hypothetical protein O7G86_13240 [Gammaproteobacteria bacterium]|nr:hypothetical protein [Gammaproteobacteria bacterium]